MDKRYILCGLFFIVGSIGWLYANDINLLDYLFRASIRYDQAGPSAFISAPLLIIGLFLLLKGIGIPISIPGLDRDAKMLTSSKK